MKKKWFVLILFLLVLMPIKTLAISSNYVDKVADILLQDPYKRLLDSLEKIADSQNEEED